MIVAPGETIGIVGGGQLGRMLALAAADLGLNAHIYADAPGSPAARVAAFSTVSAYEDEAALQAFAKTVAAVTFEFENVPARTAEILAATGVPVRPGPKALAIGQDRLDEKNFLTAIGLTCPPYAAVDKAEDMGPALAHVGAPAILKTRRLGYDGKGQARIAGPENATAAFAAIGAAPAILEAFAPFEREVSVVAARGADGAFAAFDVCENVHEAGILAVTRAPAAISADVAARAVEAARTLADALDYVGVLALELFVMPDGALWANEFAPRVHNSGHWTPDACLTGQFEQHVRAVCGWPLGAPTRLLDAEMRNLIGADVEDWAKLAADPAARVRLYGKGQARPGRKMGHVTRLSPRG